MLKFEVEITEPVEERRPLDDDMPEGYQESDRCYVMNNIYACVQFLEQAEAALKCRGGNGGSEPDPRRCIDDDGDG